MWIYLSCFTVSVFFFRAEELLKNKHIKNICMIIGLLIPSILAGCRAPSVGTDVLVYGKRFYNIAYKSDSIKELIASLNKTGEYEDFGFHLINYIVSRLFEDFHAGLFVYSLVTILIFYFACLEYKKLHGGSIAYRMLLFYFTLYNVSLNTMRQMISVSIVLWSIAFLIQKQNLRFIVLSALAVFIHSSAIISLIISGCYLLLKDKDNSKYGSGLIKTSFFVVGCGVAVLFINKIVKYLVSIGVLGMKYLNYIEGGSFSVSSGISLHNIILPMFLSITGVMLFSKIRSKDNSSLFLLMMTFVYLALSFSTVISTYFIRNSYYFVPLAYECHINFERCFNEGSKKIWRLIVFVLVFSRWLYDIALMNYHETLPYIFWNN